MGVRWRQYELIFAFALFLLSLAKGISGIPFILPLVMLGIINIWLLPRYLYTKKQLIVLPAAAILCWLLLSTAFILSSYYKSSQRALVNASLMTVIYLLYCCVREPIIKWVMQEHVKRPFRIMLCNRITATVFIYFGVMLFAVFVCFTVIASAFFTFLF